MVISSLGARRFATAFGLHLSCAVWILCVALISLARHRDLDEVRDAARDGSAEVRLEALFTLGQREAPEFFRRRSPLDLLAESDARLREFAFTNTFTRNPAQRLGDAALARLTDPHERFRASLWLFCRMTTPRRVTLADLDTWFEAPR